MHPYLLFCGNVCFICPYRPFADVVSAQNVEQLQTDLAASRGRETQLIQKLALTEEQGRLVTVFALMLHYYSSVNVACSSVVVLRWCVQEKELEDVYKRQVSDLNKEVQQLQDLVTQSQDSSGHVLEQLAVLSASKVSHLSVCPS